MMTRTTKIESISLALTLRPSRCNQRDGVEAGPSITAAPIVLSVTRMDRHRKLAPDQLWFGSGPLYGFAQCWQVRLLLRLMLFGEDRQILRGEAKDGEAERDEHGSDHGLGPLRGVTAADGALHSGDGDVQTIGDEAEQAEHRGQIQALCTLADFRHQQHAERD